VVIGLTKLEQRKEGMDDERDEETSEKDKKETRGTGKNNETDSNQPVRLSSWRILFPLRKLSRTQESAFTNLTLGGEGRLTQTQLKRVGMHERRAPIPCFG